MITHPNNHYRKLYHILSDWSSFLIRYLNYCVAWYLSFLRCKDESIFFNSPNLFLIFRLTGENRLCWTPVKSILSSNKLFFNYTKINRTDFYFAKLVIEKYTFYFDWWIGFLKFFQCFYSCNRWSVLPFSILSEIVNWLAFISILIFFNCIGRFHLVVCVGAFRWICCCTKSGNGIFFISLMYLLIQLHYWLHSTGEVIIIWTNLNIKQYANRLKLYDFSTT